MLRFILAVASTALIAQNPRPPAITSPELLADGRVIFRIWAPKAAEVQLSGDWMGPQPPTPLAKSEDGVWTVTAGPLPPNIYSYGFLVDGVRASDPACRCTLASARRFASSTFTVAGPAAQAWEPRAVAKGTLHFETYFSKAQQRIRNFVVYTPPDYHASGSRRFPVLLLLPGTPGDELDWTLGGGFAHVIFDNLIAEGKMRSMVVAMHVSDVLPSGRRVEHLREFEPIVVNDLLPELKKRYRLENKPEHWAIAGLSLGGEFAMTVGLRHPELFLTAASISGSMVEADFDDRYGVAMKRDAGIKKRYRLIWIGCGADDVFAGGNQALVKKFRSAGIDATQYVLPGFHAMPVFRQQLVELLPKLFR